MTTTSRAWGAGKPGDTMRVPPQQQITPQSVEATHLGKRTKYSTKYDPSLLVGIPREKDRNEILVNPKVPPFIGWDVWNCYEVSAMRTNGTPFAGRAKIVISSSTPKMPESKSLKLYLNSFNMTEAAGNKDTICSHIGHMIQKDLRTVCQSDYVFAKVFPITGQGALPNLSKAICIDNNADNVECNVYNEDPTLLYCTAGENATRQVVYSNLLRSNCRVTNQPDWGTVVITYSTVDGHIDYDTLLKYIVSFRNENHFHEEICERIYCAITRFCNPTELLVGCFYTRRGGIDINPIRASNAVLINQLMKDYCDVNIQCGKFPRQ